MATKTTKRPAAKKPRPPAASTRGKKLAAAARPRPQASPDLALPALPALDDIDEPDRSAPQLAEVDADVLEFIAAIDRFKKEHGRPFPSWSEVLLVVRQLGYRR